MPDDACASERVLRLAGHAAEPTASRGRGAARSHQALLARERRRVRLSQGAHRSARAGHQLRQAPRVSPDAHRGASLTVRLSPQARAPRRTSVGGRAEPAAAAVQRLRTEPGLGDRHHVHPDLRRLAVPGGGARPVLAAGDRLVDAVKDRSRTRARCAVDGGMATPTEARGHRPLRPGQSVR